MKIIISPAKNLNIRSFNSFDFDKPFFQDETYEILQRLKTFEHFQLEHIMKINPKIALQTFKNFQEFDFNRTGGHALASYDGLVFKNIAPFSFDEDEIVFAQNHIRILSAFYGVLTPLSNILPYRLEMQCKLDVKGYPNLYKFWGSKIYQNIFSDTDTVLNLASNEYSKVISPFLKNYQKFINFYFLEYKSGKFKSLATSSKIARGKLINIIIKHRNLNLHDVKDFYFDDFYFNNSLSSDFNFVFTKSI